jgi:hypothetical protein
MAKPLYVQAFEHFKDQNDDPLKAYVAYGLYIDAECKWAQAQATWPNTTKYRDWYECSVPHSTEMHNERAIQVLLEFANNIVDQERAEFLSTSLEAYRQEASKSKRGFRRGVLEATTGAFLYSVLLLIASLIIRWQGIDVVEVFEKIGADTPLADNVPGCTPLDG